MLQTWSPLSALFIGPSGSSSSARFRRRPTCPDASVAGSLPTPPVPRHRKSHSLGNKWVTEKLSSGVKEGWVLPHPHLEALDVLGLHTVLRLV